VANGSFQTAQTNAYKGNPGYAAALYLLTYGNAADAAAVAKLELGFRTAQFLAYLADDPTPVAAFFVEHNDNYELMVTSPAYRDVPGRTEALAANIEDLLHAHALAAYGPAPGSLERLAAETPWHNLRLHTTFWRPHLDAAILLSGSSGWLDVPEFTAFHSSWNDGWTYWLGWPLGQREGPDAYVRKGRITQLDYFPVDEVVQRLRALPDDKKLFAQDLMIDQYLVSTRQYCPGVDCLHDGIDRRPYLLRKAGKGALTGVLQAQPSLSGQTLKLSLRVNQKVYYIKENMYDDYHPEQLAINQYAVNYGRGLISSVKVWRGGKTFAVTEGAALGAVFPFTADVGQSSLDGIYADVTFTFFDETEHVILDLFASDYSCSHRSPD
jgi:hypothetical protein